jgi:hypothetical protein
LCSPWGVSYRTSPLGGVLYVWFPGWVSRDNKGGSLDGGSSGGSPVQVPWRRPPKGSHAVGHRGGPKWRVSQWGSRGVVPPGGCATGGSVQGFSGGSPGGSKGVSPVGGEGGVHRWDFRLESLGERAHFVVPLEGFIVGGSPWRFPKSGNPGGVPRIGHMAWPPGVVPRVFHSRVPRGWSNCGVHWGGFPGCPPRMVSRGVPQG